MPALAWSADSSTPAPKTGNGLFGINVMGVVHGCNAFLPTMIESGHGGHVVNLSSAAGLSANPQLARGVATRMAEFSK